MATYQSKEIPMQDARNNQKVQVHHEVPRKEHFSHH